MKQAGDAKNYKNSHHAHRKFDSRLVLEYYRYTEDRCYFKIRKQTTKYRKLSFSLSKRKINITKLISSIKINYRKSKTSHLNLKTKVIRLLI